MLPSRSIQDIPLLIGNKHANKHAKSRAKTFKEPLVLWPGLLLFLLFPHSFPIHIWPACCFENFPNTGSKCSPIYVSLPISLHCYSQIHQIIYYSCLRLHGAEPLLICIAADF